MQSSISHEMLTPLKCISSIIDLLKSEKLAKTVVDNLETIRSTVTFVQAQMKSKLDYCLIDSQRFQMHPEPARLVQDVVIPTCEIFKGQIYLQNIKFNVSIPEDNSTIWVDKLRVQQILINLVSNALKFTTRGGKIRLKVEKVVISDRRLRYKISVSDEGPGVDPEELQKLFTAQFKPKSKNGNGVGLQLSKKIAGHMGGDLRYFRRSRGSEFELSFEADVCRENLVAKQVTTNFNKAFGKG
jgi:signal transduction histidine kinase